MFTKRLIICGDSFCSSDPEYGESWVDVFSSRFPNLEIINLSLIGASNYLIYLQVKHALNIGCDYLIYHATSSIRQEFSVGTDASITDHYTRYNDITNPAQDKSMMCVGWNTPNVFWKFDERKTTLLKDFFTEFVDLPNLIEKNYIFITHTLNLLDSSPVTWKWSRGGFEHPSFSSSSQWDFSKFVENESSYNLWDFYTPNMFRPYYHVANRDVIHKVCDDYSLMLKLENV